MLGPIDVQSRAFFDGRGDARAMTRHHGHEPFDPATILSPEILRELPDTEEEFPTDGVQVSGPPDDGNEPDTAGELGPMAVETAAALSTPGT